MSHIMKTAFVLALALGAAMSTTSVSARPTGGGVISGPWVPPTNPPMSFDVWHCVYSGGPFGVYASIEMDYGEDCAPFYFKAPLVESHLGPAGFP